MFINNFIVGNPDLVIITTYKSQIYMYLNIYQSQILSTSVLLKSPDIRNRSWQKVQNQYNKENKHCKNNNMEISLFVINGSEENYMSRTFC